MARIRSIQPTFARSPSMTRVSRDARLLFVLLWTVVDDEGRCHGDPDDLASVLYPADADVHHCLNRWLGELETEGCIERYEVDRMDYLRIVHWHKHQWIGHPSQSFLPPSPHERLRGSGIPEASGTLRGRRRKSQPDQRVEARSATFPEIPEENAEDDGPVVVTQESVLRDLRRIRRNAEADHSHASAIRSVEAMAKIGLASGRNTQYGDDMGPSPADLLAPSGTSRSDHG